MPTFSAGRMSLSMRSPTNIIFSVCSPILSAAILKIRVSGLRKSNWYEYSLTPKKSSMPTDGELEILRVLWSRGPCTVRDIHSVLTASKRTSYNTTLKLMQIMTDKGIITRDESQRPQIYRPRLPEDQMQKRLVSDFLQKAFGGSARKLVAALTATKIKEQELKEIRQLLDELGEEKR